MPRHSAADAAPGVTALKSKLMLEKKLLLLNMAGVECWERGGCQKVLVSKSRRDFMEGGELSSYQRFGLVHRWATQPHRTL